MNDERRSMKSGECVVADFRIQMIYTKIAKRTKDEMLVFVNFGFLLEKRQSATCQAEAL